MPIAVAMVRLVDLYLENIVWNGGGIMRLVWQRRKHPTGDPKLLLKADSKTISAHQNLMRIAFRERDEFGELETGKLIVANPRAYLREKRFSKDDIDQCIGVLEMLGGLVARNGSEVEYFIQPYGTYRIGEPKV